MYEIKVTSHIHESLERGKIIPVIKMFRLVTGFGLKESKCHVEKMLGIEWSYKSTDARLVNVPRIPYTVTRYKMLKAEQLRIEFIIAGFTVEVNKVE